MFSEEQHFKYFDWKYRLNFSRLDFWLEFSVSILVRILVSPKINTSPESSKSISVIITLFQLQKTSTINSHITYLLRKKLTQLVSPDRFSTTNTFVTLKKTHSQIRTYYVRVTDHLDR